MAKPPEMLALPSGQPIISPRLDHAIRTYGGIDAALSRAPAGVVADAQAVLPALVAFMAPPVPGALRAWLARIRGGTREITETEFQEKMTAVALSSGDLPAWAFSDATLAEIFRRFTFFPEPAEIYEVVWGVAREKCFKLTHVQFLAKSKPIPERQEEPGMPMPAGIVTALLPGWKAAAQGEAYVPPQPGLGVHGREAVGPVPQTPPDWDPRDNPIVRAAKAASQKVG